VSHELDLLPNAARWGAKFTDGPVMGSLSLVASFEPFVDAEKRFWLDNFQVLNLFISSNFFFSFVSSFEPFVDAEKRFWLENFEVLNLRALLLDYWYKSPSQFWSPSPTPRGGCGLRMSTYSVYLLYWHKSADIDAAAGGRRLTLMDINTSICLLYYWITGTRVQILTQKALLDD
jgi:hypothetical protein